MTARAHPDFEAARAINRYTGQLADLFPLLAEESEQRTGGTCWRVLRSGAVVSLRRLPDGRRVLRIARREKPRTAAGPDKWAAECATFVRHLGIEGWAASDDGNATGVAVEYTEPVPSRTPGEEG